MARKMRVIIEGDIGSGKTLFAAMLANWVAAFGGKVDYVVGGKPGQPAKLQFKGVREAVEPVGSVKQYMPEFEIAIEEHDKQS